MRRAVLALFGAMALTACGDETPTGVGSGLLPPNTIRTFEIFLDGPQYLVRDTAFGEYSDPANAPFVFMASQFEGVLNANSLTRYSVPTVVTVLDAGGVARTDSTPVYLGGTLTVVVDTLRTDAGPIDIALYRTAEQWHSSATWTHRVDTAGVRVPWSQPGGTRGAFVDRQTYVTGGDTLVLNLDGATVAAWADTLNTARGALIVVETAGRRLRSLLPTLTVQLGSEINPDTVVSTSAPLTAATFMHNPTQPISSSAPRIGGVPAWRTIFQLRERMDTVTVPCPGVPNCRLRLDQVTVNHASIQLQPTPPPPGFRPEGDVTFAPFLVLPSDRLPLQRSPLGDIIDVFTTAPASRFLAPPAPTQIVSVGITEFFRFSARRDTIAGGIVPTWLALTPLEPITFGFGTFEPMPRLRLVLSVATELQLP